MICCAGDAVTFIEPVQQAELQVSSTDLCLQAGSLSANTPFILPCAHVLGPKCSTKGMFVSCSEI